MAHRDKTDEKMYQRFSLNQRVQHIFLLSLMIILVMTGLALMYHETWFGTMIIKLEGGIEMRGYIHRMAAIALILLCFYHLWYLVFQEEGHKEMRLMKCRRNDFKDFIQQLSFNLGFDSRTPLYDKYSYKEKFQYWGVAVGIVLMTLTGLILWFEDLSMILLPKWALDLTTILHGYQGLLLFLILFLWHIYNVHFSAPPLPINMIWWHGLISESEMRKNHPLEYERMKTSLEDRP